MSSTTPFSGGWHTDWSPVSQDFHRFTDAIYMMSQFIRVFVGDVDPEIQQQLAPKDVSMQQFWEQTAPPCVSEFVADEILSEMKNRRKARFVKMVSWVSLCNSPSTTGLLTIFGFSGH